MTLAVEAPYKHKYYYYYIDYLFTVAIVNLRIFDQSLLFFCFTKDIINLKFYAKYNKYIEYYLGNISTKYDTILLS
jgi:hypothetical protein